jgi:hypothetical protein
MPLTAIPMISDATSVDSRVSSRTAAHSAATPAITAITADAATSVGL